MYGLFQRLALSIDIEMHTREPALTLKARGGEGRN